MEKLVSVLLPFHDAEDTLASALGSIRRQTHDHLEVVAVDDGSTDHGAALVREASHVDGRIKLVSQPHRGLCSALSFGLTRCRGEFVARMDADDISLNRRLRLQHDFLLANPDIGVVGCLVRMVPRRGLTDGMRRYEAWLNGLCSAEAIRRDLFVESPLCHPSVMIRRRVLEQVGGYQDHRWPEDYDLWLRLDAAGVSMAKVPRVLLLWREDARRLSRTSPDYSKDRFFAAKLHYMIQRLGQRRALVWGAGQEGKPWMRALARRDLLDRQTVDVDPRKIGQKIHGSRIISPDSLPHASPRHLVLVAVGARGARGEIRGHLAQRGYREVEDYVCVA